MVCSIWHIVDNNKGASINAVFDVMLNHAVNANGE